MRRGNREGSIYRRKSDGLWVAALIQGDGRRRTFYGSTREEAAGELAKFLGKAQRGMNFPDARGLIRDYLTTWLAAVRANVQVTTYQAYERPLRLHVIPEIGGLRLAYLTRSRISALYGRLLDKGLAPGYVSRIHATLHKALADAVDDDLIIANPADRARRPPAERPDPKYLPGEEARRFLAAARQDRLYALYVLALSCGMRRGELLGLHWADVDLDGATLAVRQQVIREQKGGGLVFRQPKTAKARRSITLPDIAVAALQEHRRRQVEERLAALEWHEMGLVFPNSIGRPIEGSNLLRRSLAPTLRRAGLSHMRFHDLRHSAATLLLQAGEHPKVVQERLGHATISTTIDIYSHVVPTMQREAAARLDQVLAAR